MEKNKIIGLAVIILFLGWGRIISFDGNKLSFCRNKDFKIIFIIYPVPPVFFVLAAVGSGNGKFVANCSCG